MAEDIVTQRTLFGEGEVGRKRCSWCGATKPLSSFYRQAKSPAGRHSHCKPCQDSRRSLGRKEPARKWTELKYFGHCCGCGLWKPKTEFPGNRIRSECRPCSATRGARTYRKDRARVLAGMKRWRDAMRAEMILAYGGRCACCGEARAAFLTLDHVGGGGKEHQRRRGGLAGVMRELRRCGWPKGGFRLLCWNCNCGRQRSGGVCPHVSPPRWATAAGRAVPERPAVKRCPRCGQTKPVATDFFRGPNGAGSYCKPCAVVVHRERRRALRSGALPRERHDSSGLGFFKLCRKCKLWQPTATAFHRNSAVKATHVSQMWCKTCAKEHRFVCRKQVNAAGRVRQDLLREEVFVAYGNACACCGEREKGFLTMDHVHGGGSRERQVPGLKGGLYGRIKRAGFPRETFRLLCFNCNCARRDGACPHEAGGSPA